MGPVPLALREVITAAERSYDLFVIDTPPASVVSDAIPLLSQVGGVIVVVRVAKTTRDAAAHLRTQLRNLDARVLGVVVNAVGSDSETYGYGYGYAEKYEAANARGSTAGATAAGRDAYSDAGERTGSR